MARSLRFIQVGTGGFGGYWCSGVAPNEESQQHRADVGFWPKNLQYTIDF
jgi:hypothetical protein